MGSQMFDIKPDLITIAKGLTSAYAPLSGVIVGERVWDVISRGSQEQGAMGHGWTYSGHPVCAAAAVANLNILESRSEEHTSELQSLMRISYAVCCLKTKIEEI